MRRRPPRSTQSRSSAASDVYKRQLLGVGLGLLVLEYRMQIQGFLAGIGFDPFPVAFHGTANIPVVIDWAELAWQAVKAFVMVVVASIVPALITARQDPARSLRSM